MSCNTAFDGRCLSRGTIVINLLKKCVKDVISEF